MTNMYKSTKIRTMVQNLIYACIHLKLTTIAITTGLGSYGKRQSQEAGEKRYLGKISLYGFVKNDKGLH